MKRRLHLIHRSGENFMLAVDDASIKPSKFDDRFDIHYEADSTTILFLRTEYFDGAVLVDAPEDDE